MIALETPLDVIPGVGPRFGAKLRRLGIDTVGDLLRHFPFRYEDFSQIYPIAHLEPGQHATIQGTVEKIDVRNTWRRHMTVVEARIKDESGEIRAVWFNQPYVKNVLAPGRLANFSGKVSVSDEDIYLSHPTYELVGREETRHTARLVPVYPETKGLTSKGIRFLVQPILANMARLTDWLPESVRREHGLPELNQAFRQVHFPDRIEAAADAKRRFAFEDLFLLQLSNIQQKLRLAAQKAPAIPSSVAEIKGLVGELPFELTATQKRSLWEVLQDIAKDRPMNRLLQGDVGSGKTVVAALAAVLAAKAGFQTAIMAPTEVLARQHFETFKKLFARLARPLQPSLALLTSAEAQIVHENDVVSRTKKEKVRSAIRTGDVKIAIGTHALIQRSMSFKNLGLVIVDEQHRFGVEQRAALSRRTGREKKKLLPHFLSMSATPIPRTLMLTVFGDLDISAIEELPAGRKSIITKIVSPANRMKAYQFIRSQIGKGRQAFVICPRIDPSSSDGKNPADKKQAKLWEVKSVKEEFEKLSQKIFPDLKVGMLHGQMKSKEKESVMREFREGGTQILVSTSVIEVGVDVPNATIMMIEGSDRFGLAQLYQFRGRVGRGEHQSFCFLFTDSESKAATERLKAIVNAKNGFELAERDLALRGPGEFLGQKQTGLPDIAMQGLGDLALIRESRAAGLQILKEDPGLVRHPLIGERLLVFRDRLHLE